MRTTGVHTVFIRRIVLGATIGLATGLHAEPSLEELDQSVRILQRKLELNDEAAAAKAKESPKIAASAKDGFTITSADQFYQIRFRGLIQADARFFPDDPEEKVTDTFVLRRVRPTLEGSAGKHTAFRITPDFAGSQAALFDAYGDLKLSPLANIRAGKFKPPVGLERLQSANDIAFIERGLPTALVPSRDVGIQFYGSVRTGVVDYALGLFNGVVDGGNSDTDANDAKDVAARLFVTPFRNSDISTLKGLSFGIAGSIGDPHGTTNAPFLPAYRSGGQQTFFAYRVNPTNAAETALADGNQTRIAPQFYYTSSSFGLLGEYVVSALDVKAGTQSETLTHEAWNLTGSYVLTGEDASFKGVQPLKPFDLDAGQWGAFELVGRVGSLQIDDATFEKRYADPKKAASTAESVGVGLNWYLSKSTRIALNYERTQFDGGAPDGDRKDEDALFSRI